MSGDVAAGPITLQALVDGYIEPHALYDALRERDRVSYDPAGRCWLVTGHGAVRKILSDGRFVSDPALAAPHPRPAVRRSFLAEAIQTQIIFTDGPKQARVQRAVLTELARRCDALADPLRAAALALAEAARGRGEVDLVTEFAIPFSLHAISMVLGLPETDDAERGRLERWSTIYADLTSGYLRVEMEEIAHLAGWFRARVAERGGVPSDDLIGAFMRGGVLDGDDDVVVQCMMAFAAGRVTTQKLLGNGVPLLLAEWGAWRRAARADPSVVRHLGDELLRLVTPTRYVVRFAADDVSLAALDGDGAEERVVRRGEKVVLFLQAANRDARTFACPHALNAVRPNPHVAFGFGAHRCPGASVARIEIQVALQALLETLAEFRPHPTFPPAWDPNPNLGGYASYRCLCG